MSKITMDSIVKGVKTVPLVTILHGKESVGKTFMACQSDSSIMLDLEHGAEIYDIPKIPLYGKDVSFDDCMEALRIIYAVNKDMGVKTVIVDSFDWVQKLIHKEVCKQKNVETIDELKWGAGYQLAASLAQDFINGLDSLRQLGMEIIIICHTQIVKVDEPIHDLYEIYDLKLDRLIRNNLKEWSTIIAFCEFQQSTQLKGEKFGQKVYKAISTGDRIMHTVPQAGFVAKSRIPIPSPLPLDWKVFKSEIDKARKGD
jgi:hypothetical protein